MKTRISGTWKDVLYYDTIMPQCCRTVLFGNVNIGRMELTNMMTAGQFCGDTMNLVRSLWVSIPKRIDSDLAEDIFHNLLVSLEIGDRPAFPIRPVDTFDIVQVVPRDHKLPEVKDSVSQEMRDFIQRVGGESCAIPPPELVSAFLQTNGISRAVLNFAKSRIIPPRQGFRVVLEKVGNSDYSNIPIRIGLQCLERIK